METVEGIFWILLGMILVVSFLEGLSYFIIGIFWLFTKIRDKVVSLRR